MMPVIYGMMTGQLPVSLAFEAHRAGLLGSAWHQTFMNTLLNAKHGELKNISAPITDSKVFHLFCLTKIGGTLQSQKVKKIQAKHKKRKKRKVVKVMMNEELWSTKR